MTNTTHLPKSGLDSQYIIVEPDTMHTRGNYTSLVRAIKDARDLSSEGGEMAVVKLKEIIRLSDDEIIYESPVPPSELIGEQLF